MTWIDNVFREGSKYSGLLSKYQDAFGPYELVCSANGLTRCTAGVCWPEDKSFATDVQFKAVEDVSINLVFDFIWYGSVRSVPFIGSEKSRGVEIQGLDFSTILAATMRRSTRWSIVTTHINSNELYEDLIVIIAKDMFPSMRVPARQGGNGVPRGCPEPSC